MANEESQSEPPQQVIEGATPSGAELIFEEHKKSIVGGLAIAVIAVFGYIVVSHLQKGKQAEAANAFSEATTIADYAAASTSHSGTIAAGNALLMKADLEFTENKLNDSRATLDKFVAEYADHPLYLQGVLALGVQEEARGNLDQALTYYQQVIDAGDGAQIAPLALIRKGDVLYARGDYTGAKSVYQSVLPTYPGTPFSYKVQEKLNREKLRQAPVPPPVAVPTPLPGPAPQAATPIAVPVPVPVSPQPANPPKPASPAPTAATKPIQIPPAPKKPDAVKPDAVKPDAVKPDAVKPAPVKPAPVKPAPVKPAPVKPAPVKPKGAKPKAKAGPPATDSQPNPAKPKQPKPAAE